MVLTVVSACNFDFLDFEKHLYNDFTSSEKLHLNELDSSIPFIANDEYYFEVNDENIRYYTVGNTQKDFEEYKESLTEIGYKNVAWDIATGYTYEKGDVVILLDAYQENGKYVIEVIISSKSTNNDSNNNDNNNPNENPGGNTDPDEDNPGNNDNNGGNTDDNGNTDDTSKTYTDFTESEKALFQSYFGEVVPITILCATALIL